MSDACKDVPCTGCGKWYAETGISKHQNIARNVVTTMRLRRHRADELRLSKVFGPNLRLLRSKLAEYLYALRRVHLDALDTALAEPLEPV